MLVKFDDLKIDGFDGVEGLVPIPAKLQFQIIITLTRPENNFHYNKFVHVQHINAKVRHLNTEEYVLVS